ncbi:MAG: hypothetical protein R2699_03665 [Acidimicrobiales bacterium]
MARATADQVAVGMRGIRNADPTFDDEHFLAQARRLFLRYHRAQAEGTAPTSGPISTRRSAGTSMPACRAASASHPSAACARRGSSGPASTTWSASTSSCVSWRSTTRPSTGSSGRTGGSSADATARWINQTARTECPTCGGPRVRGTEVCQYCGVPLAYGGWIVRRVVTKDASPTTTLSRQASLAIIGGAAVVAVLAVVAVFMVRPTSGGGGADDTGTDTGASATSASLVTPVGDAGVPGTAELVLGGPLSGARSAEARSIGGDTDCSSVARFAGFSATALPGSGAAGTITLGVAVPDGKQGPGSTTTPSSRWSRSPTSAPSRTARRSPSRGTRPARGRRRSRSGSTARWRWCSAATSPSSRAPTRCSTPS